METLLGVLSGQAKKDTQLAGRSRTSPLALVGLGAVIIGTIMFCIFGLMGMRLITELADLLDAIPESCAPNPSGIDG
jgi:hypothetical protein